MKHRFLVACDYGQGGIWASLLARSRQEIEERYPALVILDEPPGWMDDAQLARIEARMTVDVDDITHPFLEAVSGAAPPD